MATDSHHLLDQDIHPPLGEESLEVVHGKLGMWTFLVMDAMTFAGFLAGYARLRWGVSADKAKEVFADGVNNAWPYPYEAFGVTGVQLTAFNTFVLVCSSVSMVHALSEAMKGNMERAKKWMIVTIIGGLFFLGVQGFEWTHLILDVFPKISAADSGLNKNFPATFLALTGFHGCHVAVGVIYNLIILRMMQTGKIHSRNNTMVEIAGLYWHFVDLIWILVFTFVYLI